MTLKSIWLYLLVFIVAFMVFAFVSFPASRAGRYVEEILNAGDSVVSFSIGAVRPGLPFKLKFTDVALETFNGLNIVPDGVQASVSPFFLLNSQQEIHIKSSIYGGQVNGVFQTRGSELNAFSCKALSWTQINVDQYQYKTGLGSVTLSCEIQGEFLSDSPEPSNADKKGRPRKKTNDVTGNGTAQVLNFHSEMKDTWLNLISLPQVDFDQIGIEFKSLPGKVELTRCTARGPLINVSLKGDLVFAVPMEKTRLSLKGKILADSPYLAKFANRAEVKSMAGNITKNGISFYIKGTLGSPKIGI